MKKILIGLLAVLMLLIALPAFAQNYRTVFVPDRWEYTSRKGCSNCYCSNCAYTCEQTCKAMTRNGNARLNNLLNNGYFITGNDYPRVKYVNVPHGSCRCKGTDYYLQW